MSFQQLLSLWGVDEALRRHPGLSISADDAAAFVLTGTVSFTATAPGLDIFSDAYELSIAIPMEFPRAIPRVRDLGKRIPDSYHRLTDGSFCLGSPARLRLLIADAPTILGFIDRCVIPYLYGYSYVEKHAHPPFGELAHGDRGIFDDYKRLLHMPSIEACASMLMLIGQKRRLANKRACPCGSRMRLGRCHNRTANALRSKLGRRWCLSEANWMFTEYVNRPTAPDAKLLMQEAAAIGRRFRKDPERTTAPLSSEAAIDEKGVPCSLTTFNNEA